MIGTRLLPGILLLFYAVTTLWLNAAIVRGLNLDAGGWVLLLGVINTPLLLASLPSFPPRRILYHSILLVCTVGLFSYVRNASVWTTGCEVRSVHGTFDFVDTECYHAPSQTPNRFPFAAVNDVWAIRDTTQAECTITWQGSADTITTVTPMSTLFTPRSAVRDSADPSFDASIILAALLLIGLLVFTDAVRAFFQGANWSWDYLVSRRSAVLFFLAGVVVGSLKLFPTDWLSNEFLSRPDDWLCYEKGARQILAGNVFLIPAPGGVEMWSPLFTYLVAALHFLFGPAMGVIHIIMHGIHYVLIWAVLALLSKQHRWLAFIVAAGMLFFVEVDLNMHYAWRLLSDTLPLLLFALLILAWKRGNDLLLLGLLCGCLYLSRLELLGIGPLLLAVLYRYNGPQGAKRIAGFSLAFLACVVPYLVRRYALFDDVLPVPLGMGASGHLHWRALLSVDHLLLKAQALFGHYDLLNPDLRFRLHWLPVHVLFLMVTAAAVIHRMMDRYIVFAIMSWVYVFFTRMVSPSIGIYGHRHSLLLILIEVIVITLVAERFIERRSARATALAP